MVDIQALDVELAARAADLDAAKVKAATATPDELGPVGALIAGLGAKVEGLRERLADARRGEAERAARQQEQAQAAERLAALDAFDEHKAAHVEWWASWLAQLEHHEAGLLELWRAYEELERDLKAVNAEAAALGVQVGDMREGGAPIFDRMRRGGTPMLNWSRRRAGLG